MALVIVVVAAVILTAAHLVFRRWLREKEYAQANCEISFDKFKKETAVSFDKALNDCPNQWIFNHLELPTSGEKKHVTPLDTLIISTWGIFVIDIKDWKGEVYGNEHQKEWTLRYDDGFAYPKNNPVWENQDHVEAVRQFIQRETNLDLDKIKIIPMVVFYNGDISHVEAKHCYTSLQAVTFLRNGYRVMDDKSVEKLQSEFQYYQGMPVITPEGRISSFVFGKAKKE